MPTILGVDSSLTGTGLALITVNAVSDLFPETKYGMNFEIQTATIKPPGPKLKTRREYSRRIASVVDDIEDTIVEHHVDFLMMEELAYGAKGATAFVLPWLWGRIIDLAEKHDVALGFANVSQVKKYATGVGNCDKTMVIARMIADYPDAEVSNDNEADALTLGLIGCRGLGYPIDHPTQKKAEVMAKLQEAA